MNIIERINDIDNDVKIYITSCFIILLLGVLPSILQSDWSWLSRSGSLLVVFGVYVAWRDYKGEIDSALSFVKKTYEKKYKESIDLIKANEKGIINPEIKKGKVTRAFEEGMKGIEDIQDKNIKTYNKIEFLVICIGTVVWGYGDLPNKLYC